MLNLGGFEVGDLVVARGLISRADLNGSLGEVLRVDWDEALRLSAVGNSIIALKKDLAQKVLKLTGKDIERFGIEVCAKEEEYGNFRVGVRFPGSEMGVRIKTVNLLLLRRWKEVDFLVPYASRGDETKSQKSQLEATAWAADFFRCSGERISVVDGCTNSESDGDTATQQQPRKTVQLPESVARKWGGLYLYKNCNNLEAQASTTTGSPTRSLDFFFVENQLPKSYDALFCLLALGACLPAMVAECESLQKARRLLLRLGRTAAGADLSLDDMKGLYEREERDATVLLCNVLAACDQNHDGRVGAIPEQLECPICLDGVNQDDWEAEFLPCGHTFHRQCMREARRGGVGGHCPICREPLPGSTITRTIEIPAGLTAGKSFRFKQRFHAEGRDTMRWRLDVPYGRKGAMSSGMCG
uniref:RING-type domain-containing protein n=1 Tax=Chromera velia CCMP2878 TaxID=1169474 RepID=A0A0G4HXV3_9ALVE|eukprot:Cvel_9354.t1-p1 / transcript=Cvel_9354.t1 / gene=Cvel_9354 / organism=Chromera_velia_CCMP2878 / gene_product=hypothetical protein / transcript_product=hypothetical protein / location=Cvel_scaffold537:21984-23225(+) / protein_length=414 / sequence_SO=supercontig / SO=protein_coding / is_pseudo=false